MGILDRKSKTEISQVASNIEQKEDIAPTQQVNEDVASQQEVRRKIAEARRQLFDAKSRLSLKELEMMKRYILYFDPRAQDFVVESREGEHGNYGTLTLKYLDYTNSDNQTEVKELVITGDYYINKFLDRFDAGEFMLEVKKTEWKGQGNRKFDLEVVKA